MSLHDAGRHPGERPFPTVPKETGTPTEVGVPDRGEPDYRYRLLIAPQVVLLVGVAAETSNLPST
jgi:hypothetical protein